jgi:hypothetical protein
MRTAVLARKIRKNMFPKRPTYASIALDKSQI